MQNDNSAPRVAIACGGTGGHLFPGVAVAGELRNRGCAVTLLVSPKEVDQVALKGTDFKVAILPAVGLNRGGGLAFARGFVQSYRATSALFKTEHQEAVLAMGGFTSAPPVLAGRACGAATFLHESNAIPGRANRWLSRVVNQAFVGFGEAMSRLRARKITVTGTPVRPQFQPGDPAMCRQALGLDSHQPVLLVTGGSQGASGLNDAVIAALPKLAKTIPDLQLFHLTGPNDERKILQACAASRVKAIVHPFFSEMHLALGAATVVISRAGASSLAELSAMRVPAVLIPYPEAMDNHQFYNATAYEKSGAARLINQREASPEALVSRVVEIVSNDATREKMSNALELWHSPLAAGQIAECIMRVIMARRRESGHTGAAASSNLKNRQTALR